MLRKSVLVGCIAAAAFGLSAAGALARGGGGFGGGFHGGGFHGGGFSGGGFHGGAPMGVGPRVGQFHGFRGDGVRHFHGRRFAFIGPYAYGGYYDDDCYWRRGRLVCPYY